jgi:hypothetical protein
MNDIYLGTSSGRPILSVPIENFPGSPGNNNLLPSVIDDKVVINRPYYYVGALLCNGKPQITIMEQRPPSWLMELFSAGNRKGDEL